MGNNVKAAAAKRREETLQLFNGTRSREQVAAALGVSVHVIDGDIKHLKKAGHKITYPRGKSGRALPGTVISKIRKLHAGGKTNTEISLATGASLPTVGRYIKADPAPSKQKKLPSLSGEECVYEVRYSTPDGVARIRHKSIDPDRAQSFALARCKGRQIVSQGFLQ